MTTNSSPPTGPIMTAALALAGVVAVLANSWIVISELASESPMITAIVAVIIVAGIWVVIST